MKYRPGGLYLPLFQRHHRQGREDAGAGIHFQGHGAEQPLPHCIGSGGYSSANVIETALHQPVVTVEGERFGLLQVDTDTGNFLPNIRFQLGEPFLNGAGSEFRIGRVDYQEYEVFEFRFLCRSAALLLKVYLNVAVDAFYRSYL